MVVHWPIEYEKVACIRLEESYEPKIDLNNWFNRSRVIFSHSIGGRTAASQTSEYVIYVATNLASRSHFDAIIY